LSYLVSSSKFLGFLEQDSKYHFGRSKGLLLLVKDALLNAGPKLGECVFTHETGEPPECSDRGSSVRGVTVGPPGIGKKVVAGSRNIPRVSRHAITFAIVSHKRHDYHASQAVSKRGIGISEITRIFAPESA
jgi:hypothetical protein